MRRGWRTTLGWFLTFQLAAVVPVTAVGVALDRSYGAQTTQETMRSAEQQGQLLADSVFAPQLGANDLAGVDPATAQGDLGAVFRNPSIATTALRVKVWDRSGRVVASDDPAIVGQTYPMDDDLQAAWLGTSHAEVSDLDRSENASEHALAAKAVEVYVPIHSSGGTQIGVLEVYLPYDQLSHDLAVSRTELRDQLLLGLVVLVGLLALVSWPVLRTLRRQTVEAQNAAVADQLTGLPNRQGFDEWLEHHLGTGRPATVALADLTAFSAVNDALGLEGGDSLLCHVADVLDAQLPQGVVARIGADDFALLIPDSNGRPPSEKEVETLLGRLRAAVGAEVDVAGVPLRPLMSIGAARFPAHADEPRRLMHFVESALAKAGTSSSGVAVFDPRDEAFEPDQLRLLGDVRRAAELDQLVLHYQPQVRASDGHVVGVEALVRWQHPDRGLLFPGAFLPVAEKTGLVGEITRWVLRACCLQLAAWQADGIDLVVSVNISARDVSDPAFAEFAERTARDAGVVPGSLCLELTETAIVADPERAREVMTALASAGFRLSLDDFGQGFTSLGQLRDLPLHELKLDRAFVDGMSRSDADRAIVSTVVGLAHNLRMSVVAEGVETADQLDVLRTAGYDVVQGWHLGRPVPADRIPSLMLEARMEALAA